MLHVAAKPTSNYKSRKTIKNPAHISNQRVNKHIKQSHMFKHAPARIDIIITSIKKHTAFYYKRGEKFYLLAQN